jgi:drug/metabolite transporter (DMT)-like permease
MSNPYPPAQYSPAPQYVAAKPRVTPLIWVGLGLFVVALVLLVDGDQSAVISAQTPLTLALIAGLAAVGCAIAATITQQRTVVWSALILGGAFLVCLGAGYDLYEVHQRLNDLRQCLSDLVSCGS